MTAARMPRGDEGIIIKTRHLKLHKCDSVVQAGSAVIATCVTMGVKRMWLGRRFCKSVFDKKRRIRSTFIVMNI